MNCQWAATFRNILSENKNVNEQSQKAIDRFILARIVEVEYKPTWNIRLLRSLENLKNLEKLGNKFKYSITWETSKSQGIFFAHEIYSFSNCVCSVIVCTYANSFPWPVKHCWKKYEKKLGNFQKFDLEDLEKLGIFWEKCLKNPAYA